MASKNNNNVRPKGMPRALWKAESSKVRQQPKKHPKGSKKDARWHFGVNTSYGSLSMGSGDTAVAVPNRPRTARRETFLTGVPTTERRELLADVKSSQTYQCTQYSIQPADSSIFEWGAPLATRFQKWKCRRLRLEYVPTVSGYAPAGQQGRIVLAGNYNPLTPQPADIRSAVAITPNVPGFPTKQFGIEFDASQITPVPLLVRTGIVPAGGTVTAYDGGVFYVAVEGTEAGVTDGTKLGEVYVVYEFEFFEPIIPGVTDAPHATFQSTRITTSSTGQTFTSGVAEAIENMVVDQSWNGLGVVTDIATGAITLSPGRYVFHGKISVTAGTSLTALGAHWTLAGSGGAQLPNSVVYKPASGTLQTLFFEFTYSSTNQFNLYPVINVIGVGLLGILANQGFDLIIETL